MQYEAPRIFRTSDYLSANTEANESKKTQTVKSSETKKEDTISGGDTLKDKDVEDKSDKRSNE